MSSRKGIVPFSVYFSVEDAESTLEDTPIVTSPVLDIILAVSQTFQRIRGRARFWLTTTHYINALHASECIDGALALCWWHALIDVASSGAFYEIYKINPDAHTVLCRWIYRTLERVSWAVVEAYTAKTRRARYKWVPIHPELDYMLQLIDFAKATSLPHENPQRFISCLHVNETKHTSSNRLRRIWGRMSGPTSSHTANDERTSTFETNTNDDHYYVVCCSRNIETICESKADMEDTLDELIRISRRMHGVRVRQAPERKDVGPIQDVEDTLQCHPLSCLRSTVSCVDTKCTATSESTGGARMHKIPNRSLHQIVSYMQAVHNKDIKGIRLKCK